MLLFVQPFFSGYLHILYSGGLEYFAAIVVKVVAPDSNIVCGKAEGLYAAVSCNSCMG